MPKATKLHFKEPKRREKHHRERKHRSRSPPSVPRHTRYEFDQEGWEPLGHKYKVANDEDEFQQRMFEEMALDEAGDYWDHVYSIPRRWRRSNIDEMSENEYAKYMRRGIWAKQHEEDIRIQKEHEERKRREKLEKERQKEKIRKEESQRQFEREQLRKTQSEAKLVALRLAYENSWKEFGSSSTLIHSYRDFVWPRSGHGFHVDDVHAFLTAGIVNRSDKLAILRDARFRFHPDKFRQRFGQRISGSADEKRILDTVVTLSQIINQIIDTYD